MKKILTLILLCLIPLSACSKSPVEGFYSYNVGFTEKGCSFEEGNVIAQVNINGEAIGDQTVKIEVLIENSDGDPAASANGEFKVNNKFDHDVELYIPMNTQEWVEGYNQCVVNSSN